MTSLTFSGESNFKSEENIKIIYSKCYLCILSIFILTLLNVTGIRLFNSLNLTMTLVSNGGFLPTDNLRGIITSNYQKIVIAISLIISMLNFYFLFNIFDKKKLFKNHHEDFYLLGLVFILTLLIYFNDLDTLNILISIISSLANSGITLITNDKNLSLYFLLITIIGGSLISNSSGIKLSRFYILLKITSSEIIKLISPNSVINKTIFNSDNKISNDNIKISFLIFISFS